MPTLAENITSLAVIRAAYAAALEERVSLFHEFQNRPDVQDLEARTEILEQRVNELTETIHAQVLADETHPACSIRRITDIQIIEPQALAWANQYMPIAVIQTLDTKLVKDYAKKHGGADWALITERKQVLIKRDLAEYMPEGK